MVTFQIRFKVVQINKCLGLLKLPGVGPKMAYLAMQCAWHDVQGIGKNLKKLTELGVDTHGKQNDDYLLF